MSALQQTRRITCMTDEIEHAIAAAQAAWSASDTIVGVEAGAIARLKDAMKHRECMRLDAYRDSERSERTHAALRALLEGKTVISFRDPDDYTFDDWVSMSDSIRHYVTVTKNEISVRFRLTRDGEVETVENWRRSVDALNVPNGMIPTTSHSAFSNEIVEANPDLSTTTDLNIFNDFCCQEDRTIKVYLLSLKAMD